MTFSGKDTAVRNLQNPRLRVPALSLLCFSITCIPAISWAQSDTAEIRPGEGVGLQNQVFDERQAQAQAQQAQARIQWIQQNNPQLWQLLVLWENTTKGYNKLSGKHRRFVYDSVFQVEKRSDGEFFYEAPDKGRIDIKPVEIAEGEKSQRLNPQGKPFALKSDLSEIWICDGKHIAQAKDNGVEKFYEVYNIPKMNQGVNIMDGPLPFLFGLPAREAVQRYDFTLLPNTNEKFIWLHVLPKREQDQRNWKEAQVILDRKTFLPFAVKLVDPAGTTETVYRFSDLKVNQNAFLWRLFGRDWSDIRKVMKDKGYKIQQNQNAMQNKPGGGPAPQPGRAALQPRNEPQPRPQPEVADGNNPARKVIMPNYLNADWKFVQKEFTKHGFQPEFRKAGPAPTPAQVYKVAKQEPAAGTELSPGQKVIFYLYEEYKAAGKP
jgi:TIGR03009 family protein